MISRSDCAFSQREMVGCEQRSSLMSGRRPQASFKAGIEPEPIEVVAVRVAAARSPTRSPRTSPSGAIPRTSLTRSLMYYAPAGWRGAAFPPSTPLSEENGPHRTRLGFSCAKRMAGGSWVGYLLSWRATKINALQRKSRSSPKRGMPATAMLQLAERRRTKGSTQVKQSAPKK